MQPNDRKAVCKMVSSITSGDKKHQYIDPINMRKWINTIVKVRNMCAHDERLYCAHIGNRKNINFAGFLLHISHLLTEKDYEDMIDAIVDLVESFSGRSNIISHILDNMGLIPAE